MKKSKKKFVGGWWDFDDNTMNFAYRSKGVRKVLSYDESEHPWYFCIHKNDYQNAGEIDLFDEVVEDVVEDGNYLRLYLPYYSNSKKDLISVFDEFGVQTFEGDVNPIDRMMLDTDEIKISTKPKVLFYDIETDARAGFENIHLHRIISVAFGGAGEEVRTIVADDLDNDSEVVLLESFADVIQDYDLLVGWNSQTYDQPVLQARCKHQKLYFNWRSVNFLDYLTLFKKYFLRDGGTGVRESFKLGNIAQKLLGEEQGKEDVEVHKLHEYLETDEGKKKLALYNKRDVEILQELDKKFGYISAQAILAKICNRFLSDKCLGQSNVVDGFVLKYANKRGVRYQSKFYDEENKAGKIEGAYVMDPKLGLHEGVCDLDFSSLYPSLIIAYNISPETLVDDEYEGSVSLAANGARFSTEVEGIFPAIERKALKRRQKYKDRARELEEQGKDGSSEHQIAEQISNAWKTLANSAYGNLSGAHSRYYSVKCGEGVTVTGQATTKGVISFLEEQGIIVVYSDTDSIFVKCNRDRANELSEMIFKYSNDVLRRANAKEGWIKLKLDAEFDRLFFTAKKRYAGRKNTGKWHVRGLEMIRTDNCLYARNLQKRIVEYILESKKPTYKMAEKICKQWASRLYELEVAKEYLQLSQAITKDLDDYKVNSVHIRIAKKMLAEGKEVFKGMRIPYVITGTVDNKQVAIHTDDFDGKYDADLYWEQKCFPPVQRILDCCFGDEVARWKDLLRYRHNRKQRSLFEVVDDVVFVLNESDQDLLEDIKSVCDDYVGNRVLKIEIETDGETAILKTGLKVSLEKELIIKIEKMVGHKVFYGLEEWD